MQKVAKRWLIGGTVQGVGFRYFAQKRATALGIAGWARNLNDGRVEVYAIGTPDRLSDFGAALHIGPHMAEVRSMEEQAAAVEKQNSFDIK
jgi:acylphosphatase